jgi:hypothetical protein
MGGRGRADGLIVAVAVAVACGLEPWIFADFDSADHEPYSSPCNVSHVHGEAAKKHYVRSSPQLSTLKIWVPWTSRSRAAAIADLLR